MITLTRTIKLTMYVTSSIYLLGLLFIHLLSFVIGSYLKKYVFCLRISLVLLYVMNFSMLFHYLLIIIIIIFKCYFSGEHIALSLRKSNNGVNIELERIKKLKALCMMQINTCNTSN